MSVEETLLSITIDGPIEWNCSLCNRRQVGYYCANGHLIDSPAFELLQIVKFLAAAVHEPWVEPYVREKLGQLFGPSEPP